MWQVEGVSQQSPTYSALSALMLVLCVAFLFCLVVAVVIAISKNLTLHRGRGPGRRGSIQVADRLHPPARMKRAQGDFVGPEPTTLFSTSRSSDSITGEFRRLWLDSATGVRGV